MEPKQLSEDLKAISETVNFRRMQSWLREFRTDVQRVQALEALRLNFGLCHYKELPLTQDQTK